MNYTSSFSSPYMGGVWEAKKPLECRLRSRKMGRPNHRI
jgi:hypothetical protein